MVNNEKEVYFHKYCKLCKHFKKYEDEEPCCDCLDEPVNTHSHKPVYFEKVEKDGRNTRIRKTS